MEAENTISDGDLAYVVSKVAYAHGRLQAEDRLTEKDFDHEIDGLEEATTVLQEIFSEDVHHKTRGE